MNRQNRQTYFLISGAVFGLVALGHLFRLVNHSPVLIGTWPVPMAGSWAGLIVAGLLSCWGFALKSKEG